MRTRRLDAYAVIAWLAFGWAFFNCTYVYLYLQGARIYRLESAVFILSAILVFGTLRPRQSERSEPTYPRAAAALTVVAVVSSLILFYIPLLDFPLLSDDYVFLDRYRDVGDALTPTQFFRPLFAALFAVLSGVGAGSVVPFHVTALVLHLGCGWLVFRLSNRLLQSKPAALLCLAIFTLNPLQLEAVLWISGLQELLWTFLMLAAIDCYTRKPQLSPAVLFTTLMLVAGSLLAKETAVCFILLLPAVDGVLYRFQRGPIAPLGYVLMAAELLSYWYVRQQFAPPDASFFAVPSLYFVKQMFRIPYAAFVQPWNTAAYTVPPFVAWLATVAALAVVTLSVVLRRVSGRVLIGPYIILASTLPVYSFFFVAPDLLGSRYLYFAMFGWALLSAELISALLRTRIGIAAATGLLMIFSLISLQLNLRPWTAAAAYVVYLTDQIRRDVSPPAATSAWQQSTGVRLTVVDGVAREHQGVTIFRNGFPQFLDRVKSKSGP